MTLYDYISDENGHHLVMELISGVPLDSLINNTTGPINELRAINIFLDVFSSDPSDWVRVEQVPPMPVRLFKMHDLFSIDSGSIAKTKPKQFVHSQCGYQGKERLKPSLYFTAVVLEYREPVL